MDENNIIAIPAETEQAPVFRMKIRETTYVVKVNFSDNAKETLETKIKRMLRNEVEQNVNAIRT